MAPTNSLYIGNYQLLDELGGGSLGQVYLGKHMILPHRLVAIKWLRPTCKGSQKVQESFLHEAQLLESLQHPHIVPLLDAGFQEQRPYIITLYASGGSLKEQIDKRAGRPFSERAAVSLLVQIGQAVQFLHERRVVHRDLKPANLLLNSRNEIWLADFGIATMLETGDTVAVDPVGTPAFMAPEQFEGQVSQKSDQYALGCIAYELVTGRKPFVAPNAVSMGYLHMSAQPVPPTIYNPRLSKHIERAILKAMAKRRQDRYQNMISFVMALFG